MAPGATTGVVRLDHPHNDDIPSAPGADFAGFWLRRETVVELRLTSLIEIFSLAESSHRSTMLQSVSSRPFPHVLSICDAITGY